MCLYLVIKFVMRNYGTNLLEKKGYKFLHSRKNRTNKNNGLEKEDESFLERLKGYLRRISGQGEYHSI